jgi:hypothetical protein
MAQEASVRIDLAAEFTGKKAFKQADTATQKLTKNVKQLGGALGLAFGTAAVVNFSKQAVKAFAQDEAAAVRLTRAVENLGIGFANPAISKYIAELERSAAIADDVLRPAFQGLLTTTGSLTKSQELLNNAITISRASGIDLATVSTDLARGYVGITKGLKKYNTGLTTAEISSKSFAEVLGVILTRSAGAADDYLQTTQYRMDSLSIATGNASEIIGGGLVNAFARIGGGTEASDAAKAIEDIAEAVAFTTEQIGALLGVIPNLIGVLKNLPKNILGGVAGLSPNLRPVTTKPTPKPKPTPTELSLLKQQELLAKLEADALKRQKALLALQKKQGDAAKKAAADKARLDKAAAVFELQKIQIAAALKGKISDEERTRLLLMQAIEEGNVDKAEALAKKLEEIQKQNAKIAADLLAIGSAKDPFATWAGSLSLALLALGKLGKGIADVPGLVPGVNFNPSQNADRNYDQKVAAVVGAITGNGDTAGGDVVIESIFADDDTIDDILTKVENVAADAADAAESAAASVAETQVTVDALATAATNSMPVAGMNFNPYQNRDRNYDTGGSASPTIIVNNTGSVIMQDEFVDAVNNALLAAERTGYNRTPAGFLTI